MAHVADAPAHVDSDLVTRRSIAGHSKEPTDLEDNAAILQANPKRSTIRDRYCSLDNRSGAGEIRLVRRVRKVLRLDAERVALARGPTTTALVVTGTFTTEKDLVVDARALGLSIALIALLARAPVAVALIAAAAAAALARLFL